MAIEQLEMFDLSSDRIEDNSEFLIGDRVIFANPRTPAEARHGIGVVMKIDDHHICVKWQNTQHVRWQENGVNHEIDYNVYLRKSCEIEKVLGYELDDYIHIPELSRNGCMEWYTATNNKGKKYRYWRYVYHDAKGIYKHHHVPYKQLEAISALWASGASAKEICVALGKKCKSK